MDQQIFHAERRSGIGSSDAPVIMGISSFKTPMELWLEKTGQRAPAQLSDNEPVHWGTRLEDVIAAEFADRHPELTVRRHRRAIRSRDVDFALAHLDRATRDRSGCFAPLEIKTSSKWDDWKDGVPLYYQPQVQHQLFVTRAKRGYVAVLVNGRSYQEYVVERDEAYIAVLIDEETAFMKCVRALTPPAPKTYHDVCLRYPIAQAGARCTADSDLLACAREYGEVNAKRLSLEKRENELKKILGLAMGTAQTLVDADGTPLVNFTSSQRTAFSESAHAAEVPDCHARFLQDVPYRQMRPLKALKQVA